MFGEHFRKWQPTILKWYINIFNLNFFLLYKKSAYDTIYNLKSGFNTITSKYPLGLKWHLHNLSYIVNIRGCKSLSLFFHTLMCLIICGQSTAHLDTPGYVRGRSLHISLQTLVMLVTQEHAMCVCVLCVCVSEVDEEKRKELMLRGVPEHCCQSYLWEQSVRDNVTDNKISEQVCHHFLTEMSSSNCQ